MKYLVPVFLRLATVMACLCGLQASAATFFVSDIQDSTNVTSLRGAIIAANASGGGNVIVLTNSVYPLTIQGADEDAGYTGDLDITNGSLTIIGASSTAVVIDATGLGDRVFQILPNAQLTMTGILITGGRAPGGGDSYLTDGEVGGGIYNMGTLILEGCTVSSNTSGGGGYPMGNGGGTGGGGGGGVYNSGYLVMGNCSVLSNASGSGVDGAFGGSGGGIYNSGECYLTGCIVDDNVSGQGGPPEGNFPGFGGSGGNGGGIFNCGMLRLINCTICGNSTGSGASGGQCGNWFGGAPGGWGGSGGNGAGLYNAAALWLDDCTISSNFCGGGGTGGQGSGWYGSGGRAGAGGSGAGIYTEGTLNLNTCTVGGNSCGNAGNGGYGFSGGGAPGGTGGGGGGVCNIGVLNVTSCTIAMNSTGLGGNGGCANDTTFQPASAADGGNGGNGGGILNINENTAIKVRNTIVALNSTFAGGTRGTNFSGAIGNIGLNGTGLDAGGAFLSQGFNLISCNDGMTGFTNSVNGDQVGITESPINPHLSPLQMNGGSAPTFALLPGSPAIDAGDDSILSLPGQIPEDQRGDPRLSGAHVDIGAFEYNGLLNGMVLPPVLTQSGMSASGMQFWFNGANGLNYSVWASSDLATWVQIGSASEISSGWFNFQDAEAPNYGRRFYQVRYP